ncbi:MAG TPA: hypothetical protein VFR04_09455 [Solirubrobacterales bacterium]|nr:hypothetical protein [Solirubrobacterales bacterium]
MAVVRDASVVEVDDSVPVAALVASSNPGIFQLDKGQQQHPDPDENQVVLLQRAAQRQTIDDVLSDVVQSANHDFRVLYLLGREVIEFAPGAELAGSAPRCNLLKHRDVDGKTRLQPAASRLGA